MEEEEEEEDFLHLFTASDDLERETTTSHMDDHSICQFFFLFLLPTQLSTQCSDAYSIRLEWILHQCIIHDCLQFCRSTIRTCGIVVHHLRHGILDIHPRHACLHILVGIWMARTIYAVSHEQRTRGTDR